MRWVIHKRLPIVIIASVIFSLNIKCMVQSVQLIPGGFTGITLLIQHIFDTFFGIYVPFSLISLLLNCIPVVLGFLYVGKRFTVYSCIMIALTALLTDLLPVRVIVDDIILVSVFGGIVNGFVIALCLWGECTLGGTEFIGIVVSERYKVDPWDGILMANVIVVATAGFLFGWEKAMYSTIYQYVSTQVVHFLYRRYQKSTLLIVTKKPESVYEKIRDTTHHDATLFQGVGAYANGEENLVYSVVSADQVRGVIKCVKEVDPIAFVNVVKSEQVNGRFYQKPQE